MQRRLLMISTDRKIFEEGSEVRARQIEYAKEWEEVHVIIFAGKKFDEQPLASNCWAYSTRSRSKFLYPFDAIKLGRFIIEKRGITDITCQDASLTAMAGAALKKEFAKHGKDLQLELQLHEDIGSPNYNFNWTNKIRRFMALNYLPKADHIRVVSNRIKEFLIERFDSPNRPGEKIEDSKIEVRQIAVDIESIRSTPIIADADLHKKYPQFDKIVLMAGRLEAEKNMKLAIEAWRLVIEKQPKVGLIIVGSGSQSSILNAQCSRSGISSNVVFESWAGKPTLISYYKTADLFLNTSLFEGYGMALVEAKAAGCKIVSTDVGVVGEILKDGENGITIVDWNAESVADGIIKIIS